MIDMLKSKYIEKELYLYLVDEFSGRHVFDPKCVYPIVIEVNNAELAAKHVPLMMRRRNHHEAKTSSPKLS